MGSEQRMPKMKETMKRLVELQQLGLSSLQCIGLLAWDTTVNKATDLVHLPHAHALEWVDNLAPRGGNNMKNALLVAGAEFALATDFVVLCDGDPTPFSAAADWKLFYDSQLKPKRVHFVSISQESPQLKEMSQVSAGEYIEAPGT